MNISALGVLGSVITYHPVSEDHLLYIGMGIGLSSGLLCAIVILHYKYIKFIPMLIDILSITSVLESVSNCI